MKKQITSARLLIMMTGSLPPGFFGNWTSFGGHLLLITLPLTSTRRSQNILQDSGASPGTAGVDAFFQDWQHENCLVVPPVVLFPKVLFSCFPGGHYWYLTGPQLSGLCWFISFGTSLSIIHF